MVIAFSSRSLRTLCENEDKAHKKLGRRVTEKLKARLEDMQAASTVSELAAGNPRPVNSGSQPCMIVDLDDGYIMEFVANHISNPVNPSGEMDWLKVRRVKLLNIRYNDV